MKKKENNESSVEMKPLKSKYAAKTGNSVLKKKKNYFL